MTLLKTKFSKTLNDQDLQSQDPENPAGCSICCSNIKNNETMTTIPNCTHKYHFDCLQVWLKCQTTCPCCRSNIRKSLIEHYHGKFTYRGESFHKRRLEGHVISNELSIDRSKNNLKLIDESL